MTDMPLLQGEIEFITAMQWRAAPGDILDSVLSGKVFVVTRNKKPVAVISRVPGQQLAIVIDSEGKRSYALES